MKLGILGGTFNPVHNGHIAIAQAAETQFDLDRILFAVAGTPPHRAGGGHDIADAAHRSEMLRLALDGHPRWVRDEREIRRGGISYTVDTLESVRKEHSGAELFFILGSDNLASFGSWREPARIAGLAELLVYERAGARIPSAEELGRQMSFPVRLRAISGARMDVSATEVRARIRSKKNASKLVPAPVLAYIEKHKLYQ